MNNIRCLPTGRIVSVAALLSLSAACASVHVMRASSGENPREATAKAFRIAVPEYAALSPKAHILRITTRPFVGGESCLVVRWEAGGIVDITTMTSDTCIHCVVSGLQPGQKEEKVANIQERRYRTNDSRVRELLEVVREQMQNLTFYEQIEYVDPTYFDFELYDHAGVKRRMTIQGVNKPYQGGFLISAAFKLEQFPLAHNKEEWDRTTLSEYQDFTRKNPKKTLVPSIQDVLASHLTEQELMAQCAELAYKMKVTEPEVAGFVFDPSQDYAQDPKSGAKIQIQITTVHPPGETANYFFPNNSEGPNQQ
jgi:hypothetical protein